MTYRIDTDTNERGYTRLVKTIRVLNCGAGRQSAAMVAMACNGDLDVDVVIHADTGNERKATLQYIDQVIAPALAFKGIPFYIVRNGNIREDTLRSVREGTRIANAPYYVDKGAGRRKGMLKRMCTSEYKIVPIKRKVRELLGLKRGQRGVTLDTRHQVIQMIGIAIEERQRAKGAGPRDEKWIELTYPLLERGMSTRACIEYLRAVGWPVPIKSACIDCPYRSDASWARMRRDDAASWADAIDFDEKLRWPEGRGRLNHSYVKGASFPAFVHPSCVPLAEVNLDLVDIDGPESFGGEC